MTTANSAEPKRRFLRFRLRALLLLMLVVCVTLGWRVEEMRRQWEHAIQDELEKDAEFLSLRYEMGQIRDELEMQAVFVRPGSPALNPLQQQMAQLQRKQDQLREVLTPIVVGRLKARRLYPSLLTVPKR